MASPLAPEIEAAKTNAKIDVVFGLLCKNSYIPISPETPPIKEHMARIN